MWSAGCVLAELLLGQPIFPGDSGVDQLVEIIKVLGTPTRDQIKEMNPNYTEFKFPQIKSHPWQKVSLRLKFLLFFWIHFIRSTFYLFFGDHLHRNRFFFLEFLNFGWCSRGSTVWLDLSIIFFWTIFYLTFLIFQWTIAIILSRFDSFQLMLERMSFEKSTTKHQKLRVRKQISRKSVLLPIFELWP